MMDMLRSEVRLLLVRNNQLEDENNKLIEYNQSLREQISSRTKLNVILEKIRSSQREHIHSLQQFLLLIESNDDAKNHDDHYLSLKNKIQNDSHECQQLMQEYDYLMQMTIMDSSLCNTNQEEDHEFVWKEYNEDSIKGSETSCSKNVSQSTITTCSSYDESTGNSSAHYDEVELEEEDDSNMYDDPDDGNVVEDAVPDDAEESDNDPNGIGVDYFDANDKEFIPNAYHLTKRKAEKITKKSNDNKVNRKGRRPRIKRSFKTAQKCGDKFKCVWKGCDFFSCYKQNVERHFRVHTGERPFRCEFKGCTFAATQAGNLKVHRQRHGHYSQSDRFKFQKSKSKKHKEVK